MKGVGAVEPVSQLDFESEYGRQYRTSIQHSIPGHATLLEIGAAAIGDAAPAARRILVVGPGPGDELPQLLDAFRRLNLLCLSQVPRCCRPVFTP